MRPALSQERMPVSIPENDPLAGRPAARKVSGTTALSKVMRLYKENKETRYNNEEFDPGSG